MELSQGKQLRYSLWIIPLVVPVLYALVELVVAPPFNPNGWYAGYNTASCFINALCPLGYAFAWMTAKSREDRLTFLAVLATHLLLVSLTMLLGVMRLRGVPEMILEWLFLAEAFGAFVLALMRRKAVVVRAVLWREPEQREARQHKREMRVEAREAREEERQEAKLRQEEALIESERQKMAEQTRGKRGGRRMKPVVSARALDVDTPAATPQAAPGSALAAALGATPAPEAAPMPAAAPAQIAETLQDAGAPQVSVVGEGRSTSVRVDMAPNIETTPAPAPTAVTPTPTAHAQGDSSLSSTVDVNTCTPTELLTLSGMTAATARAIVDEREAHGPYRSVEDVVARNGLKPHVVASFITHLSVNEAPAQPRQEGRRGRVLDL